MDPLNKGIFTFKINANHIVPINEPTRIKIIADIIIGYKYIIIFN